MTRQKQKQHQNEAEKIKLNPLTLFLASEFSDKTIWQTTWVPGLLFASQMFSLWLPTLLSVFLSRCLITLVSLK